MNVLQRSVAVGLVAVVAGLAAACLPAGTRGSGSHPDGTATGAATPTLTSTPAAPTGPTPIPSFVPPTPTPMPTFLVYTVKKGDNLNTIAHAFGTTARSIAFWNRATYPSLDPESPSYRPGLVHVGWTLSLVPNLTVDEQDLPDPSGSDDPALSSEEAGP